MGGNACGHKGLAASSSEKNIKCHSFYAVCGQWRGEWICQPWEVRASWQAWRMPRAAGLSP